MTEKLTSEAAQRAAQRIKKDLSTYIKWSMAPHDTGKWAQIILAEMSLAAPAERKKFAELAEFLGAPYEEVVQSANLPQMVKDRRALLAEVSELREALRKANVLVEMAYKTPQWLQECRSEESDEAREFIGAILKKHGDGI